jgi:hypothetical protein
MNWDQFMHIKNLITPLIARQDTQLRKCVPVDKRLALTLVYLATGETLFKLSTEFVLGESTCSTIIAETIKAISFALKSHIRTPTETTKWQEIAEGFYERWDYPNCLGAIDGKHIAIQKPAKSGSLYFNYKGFYSIVLMAIVSFDYR